MAKIAVENISEKPVWEDFLKKHPEANFLQSWYWGEFHESLGRKIFRVGFLSDGNLVGTMLAYIERSKRGRFLVVPGGPIIDWGNKDLVKEFGNELRRIGIENKCLFARVRPQLTDNEESRKVFSEIGLKKAPMYLHAELTSQLDITKPEEELMALMRKSTRYELKKAINLNITIEENGKENIEIFYDLQLQTAVRQKFVPFSKDFLLKQFKIFIDNNKATLYTAKHEGKVLAQAFIIFYGSEAVYHYGASTEDGRHYPGAYLLQWKAILEARKRGIKRYNFWGVSPLNTQSHRFSGISLFKRGFGGVDVQYLPAQDLIINKGRYFVDYWIEKIRRKVRNV